MYTGFPRASLSHFVMILIILISDNKVQCSPLTFSIGF